MTQATRVALALTLAAATLAGCATRDMDECRRGDRSRCPGEASRLVRPLGG
jgi:hypothetical protein